MLCRDDIPLFPTNHSVSLTNPKALRVQVPNNRALAYLKPTYLGTWTLRLMFQGSGAKLED